MNREIIWSPAAEKDLESILEYLQNNWNNLVISKFIEKIDGIITLIHKEPIIFPVVNKTLKIRKCVITKQNTLYYRIVKNKIEIVRLFDSRQKPVQF